MDGFAVGITGHRDIRDADVLPLETAVQAFLQGCVREHGPLVMLNSLAEGADMLCARVALRMGIPLHAILPMPIGDYQRTFSAPGSSAALDALLMQCARVQVTKPPPPVAEGRRYQWAGRYVAEQSGALLALWNGEERIFPEGGGTYETIRFALDAGREVWQLVTPRISMTVAVGEPYALRRVLPTESKSNGS